MIFVLKKILLPALLFCIFLNTGITALADEAHEAAFERVYFEASAENSPYQSYEKNGMIGFEDELVQLIFKDSKYKAVYIQNEKDKIKTSSNTISFRTKDAVNDSDLLISDEVYSRNFAFFTLEERRFINLDSNKLKDIKIGVLENSYPEYKITEFSITPVIYSSADEGIEDLKNGKIDAWFDDVNDANYIMIQKNLKSKIKYHNELTFSEPIYVIISHGSDTLGEFINKRLNQIKDSGEFEGCYLKYFLAHSSEYQLNQKRIRIIETVCICFVVMSGVFIFLYFKAKAMRAKNKFNNTITKSILKHGNRFIILWASDFSRGEVNTYFKNIFGSDTDKTARRLIYSFFGKEDGKAHEFSSEEIENLINSDSVLTNSADAGGEIREIMWTSILINSKGNVKTVLSIGSDMTEKNRLKRELKLSDERYQLALASANIAIIFISNDGKVPYISDLGYRLMGLAVSEKPNIQSLLIRICPDDREEFASNILDCSVNTMKSSSCEVRVLGESNEYRWFAFKFKQIFNPTTGDPCMAGAFYDINDDKEKDLKIEKLAFEDDLTQIYNRRKFLRIVKSTLLIAKSNALRYAVVTFNLDNFHRFNDLYGVEAGDKILKAVANILKDNPYGRNCTCARLGNDEYALLAELEPDEEHLEQYIGGISEKIQAYTSQQYDEMRLTISAGACIFPDNVNDYHDIYERSIFSMRIAKSRPNMFYLAYDNSIKELILKRDILEKEIREAIEKKQFELYYQPKVDIFTEKIVGAEALIRWNHPTRGIVSPNEFIHVAEEIGVISEIGKWTLKTACAQNKLWQEQGLTDIKVSVNISSIEFYQPDFVSIVKSAFSETGLEPKWLEIELTESMALDNITETIKKMNDLKVLGVGISMDDFGTGYSSLSYLQNLPIDELKLDKSFIDKITNDETTENIVSTIIKLAKIIGLVVVAEGVERREQLNLLKEMNCNLIQGFLFSKPVTKEEIIKMM